MTGRTRDVSPGFFTNENWPCPLAQILFLGLVVHADREGRLEDRPKRLKSYILPHWDCDVEDLLAALCPEFISRYRVGESRYIQVLKFERHQKHIHPRESESEIPPELTEGHSKDGPKTDQGHSKAEQGYSGIRRLSSSKKGVQGETNDRPPDRFEEFWEAFPPGRRKSPGVARRSWKQALKRVSAEVIIAAARDYAASNEGLGRFVKMPSTWLNGECWNDDREAWNRNQDLFGGKQPERRAGYDTAAEQAAADRERFFRSQVNP